MKIIQSHFHTLALIATVSFMPPTARADNTPNQMGYHYRGGSVDVFYFGKEDRYAAIAYSPTTGDFGYAQDCYSREIAERTALRHCEAQDARIVGWVCNGFSALAVGSDGAWGTAYSNSAKASNTAAKQGALKCCQENCSDAKLQLCVCSAKRPVEEFVIRRGRILTERRAPPARCAEWWPQANGLDSRETHSNAAAIVLGDLLADAL